MSVTSVGCISSSSASPVASLRPTSTVVLTMTGSVRENGLAAAYKHSSLSASLPPRATS